TTSTPPTTLAGPRPRIFGRRGPSAPAGPLRQAMTRTLRNPMGMFGACVLAGLLICAVFAAVLSPYDPLEQHPGSELLPPGSPFPLGTDNLGRDLLSRIIFGSRASLLVGVVAIGLGASIGMASGLA